MNKKIVSESFKITTWEYIKVIVSALAIAFFIRSFIFEPFKIPSSSMVPTLLVGDYLFVNKFNYGLKIPFTKTFITEGNNPKRGDIAVFKRNDERMGNVNFIKRIVAVPGDKIAYLNKKIYINDKPASMQNLGKYTYSDSQNNKITVSLNTENLAGVKHYALIDKDRVGRDLSPFIVPKNKYVVMGDNRDNSLDARFWNYPNWGYIDKGDIVGRAEFIFWSWDSNFMPRFERIANSLRSNKAEIVNAIK